MRPSESLALKWKDIDLNKGRITINRTLSRVTGKNGWTLESPKTEKSRRTIPISPSIVEDLKEHRAGQAVEILREEGYKNLDFVFTANNGEPMSEGNLSRRDFKKVFEKAGLPKNIRFYDLRHTCATLLLAAGENPKIVSERLGHASITLTLDTYSHVLPDMQKTAADKLEEMLFNPLKKKRIGTLPAH